MTGIPTVDLSSPDPAPAILEASEEIGFVALTGHEIAADTFEQMRDVLRRLFSLDDSTKRTGAITRHNYRGFIPLGFFTPNRTDASGEGADLYEGYKLHWECPSNHPVIGECALYGPNLWRPEIADMRSVVLDYWHRCDVVSARLLDIFASRLGVEPATFARWHSTPLTNMTLLHYPAQAAASPKMGIHPHKDTNVITLLNPDPVGGLHVRRRDGSWIGVEYQPGALLMNIGEMLELWSGGRYVATPHRVINTSGQDRYAFPYFVVPNHDIVVEPVVESMAGFTRAPMEVGAVSVEVWRTNWPDAESSTAHDLGTLDR